MVVEAVVLRDDWEDALDKDVRAAAREMRPRDIRVLVDHYYALQDLRLQVQGKVRAVKQGRDEGAAFVVSAMFARQIRLEQDIKAALAAWVQAQHDPSPTAWAARQVGIGPVIAAALAAHLPGTERVMDNEQPERSAHIALNQAIDPGGWERTRMVNKEGEILEGWVRPRSVPPTVGHWWRFAGLDPTLQWGKGELRPWNAKLKVVCYKIGESFVKVSGNEAAFYGQLYRERKAWELEKDARGENAAVAAAALAKPTRWTEGQRKAYESGHLPPAQLHRRATRWTAKLFLAHYHEAAYLAEYGTMPPKPYVLEHVPGHVHAIKRPA